MYSIDQNTVFTLNCVECGKSRTFVYRNVDVDLAKESLLQDLKRNGWTLVNEDDVLCRTCYAGKIGRQNNRIGFADESPTIMQMFERKETMTAGRILSYLAQYVSFAGAVFFFYIGSENMNLTLGVFLLFLSFYIYAERR